MGMTIAFQTGEAGGIVTIAPQAMSREAAFTQPKSKKGAGPAPSLCPQAACGVRVAEPGFLRSNTETAASMHIRPAICSAGI